MTSCGWWISILTLSVSQFVERLQGDDAPYFVFLSYDSHDTCPLIKAASHKELLLRSKIVNAKYMCLRRIKEVLDNEINIFIAA